jgi:hypothetical protein
VRKEKDGLVGKVSELVVLQQTLSRENANFQRTANDYEIRSSNLQMTNTSLAQHIKVLEIDLSKSKEDVYSLNDRIRCLSAENDILHRQNRILWEDLESLKALHEGESHSAKTKVADLTSSYLSVQEKLEDLRAKHDDLLSTHRVCEERAALTSKEIDALHRLLSYHRTSALASVSSNSVNASLEMVASPKSAARSRGAAYARALLSADADAPGEKQSLRELVNAALRKDEEMVENDQSQDMWVPLTPSSSKVSSPVKTPTSSGRPQRPQAEVNQGAMLVSVSSFMPSPVNDSEREGGASTAFRRRITNDRVETIGTTEEDFNSPTGKLLQAMLNT